MRGRELVEFATMADGRATSASGDEGSASTPKDLSKSELEKKTRIRGMSPLRAVQTVH